MVKLKFVFFFFESDTGVRPNIITFMTDVGIIEILAPVSTIDFILVALKHAVIYSSEELYGSELILFSTSFPNHFQ